MTQFGSITLKATWRLFAGWANISIPLMNPIPVAPLASWERASIEIEAVEDRDRN